MTRRIQEINDALAVMGLSRKLSIVDLKKRFRKLSRENHPDHCNGKEKELCTERFRKMRNAYKLLHDFLESTLIEISDALIEQKNEPPLQEFYGGWWW